MHAVERLKEWKNNFKNKWLAEFNYSGRIDWDLYSYVKNTKTPSSIGIGLKDSKIVLITSAGSYLKNKQRPFDAANPLGDYSIRTYPASTNFINIEFAHDHYKQDSVRRDPQVLIPTRHLFELVNQGVLGQLFPKVISFMGYQPDITQVVSETIPQIQSVINDQDINCALLVPS